MKLERLSPKNLRFLQELPPEVVSQLCREANLLLKKRLIRKQELLDSIRAMVNKFDESQWIGHSTFPLWRILKDYANRPHKEPKVGSGQVSLLPEPLNYAIFGKDLIESGAIAQMDNAMSLPIIQAGALMPDAHEGYGLPIGGVVATQPNTVIPYAVGVDIACRMCMSIFPMQPKKIDINPELFRSALGLHTHFGVGAKNSSHLDASVFDQDTWAATKIIRQHRNLAFSQLGTSGAGNHFVEWGELTVLKDGELEGLMAGQYVALLSHSGSRGFGNEIATHYSRVAMATNPLPQRARHLAWLDLDSEEGEEYWVAMNLAGQYASANHHEIHEKITRHVGCQPTIRIENHHNFAWKEKLPDGRKAIVHRKGATPAWKGVIGIVPGSMAHPSYVVRGLGNDLSLASVSHGAGRRMSRAQALKAFDRNELERQLKKHSVELIGGDLDEAPMAYKDIGQVMAYQSELVEVLAIFKPRIVRMAEPRRGRR